jgi:DNA-binding CsgD family transcriptional regulator
MGVRQRRPEELGRLEAKTLTGRLKVVLKEGLNCSAFEAEAVINAVHDVYSPFLGAAVEGSMPPGTISLVAVDSDEPAGKPIAACQKRTIQLLVHRGIEDDRILREKGPAGFRLSHIASLCQEAMSKGALLTREDLAYRVFFTSPRTISRDLAALRRTEPDTSIPLRGTVHDLGPVLTHRVQIVRLALKGKSVSQICVAMHHSPAAVANYLSTFTRCAQLAREKMAAPQIAFLLRRGEGLIRKYLELLDECRSDPCLAHHLRELERLGGIAAPKKRPATGLPKEVAS